MDIYLVIIGTCLSPHPLATNKKKKLWRRLTLETFNFGEKLTIIYHMWFKTVIGRKLVVVKILSVGNKWKKPA